MLRDRAMAVASEIMASGLIDRLGGDPVLVETWHGILTEEIEKALHAERDLVAARWLAPEPTP